VEVALATPAGSLARQAVRPNEEWSITAGAGGDRAVAALKATLRRSSPFVPPFA
jgi:hypothetical protein